MDHEDSKQAYIHSMHQMGRFAALIALIMMIAMPTIVGIYFDAMPSLGQIIRTSVGLLAVFFPIAISEVVSYTPILGSSIYLTLITGNVLNLKLPVATNAMKLLDVEYGSEDADVISSIAISVSSFITVLIVALGVVLMIPLKPILTIPEVEIATSYILPALFGCLTLSAFTKNLGGGVVAPGRLKGIVLPVIFVCAITLLDTYVLHMDLMSQYQGFVIVAMLPVAYYGTKWLYQKGHIRVILPGDQS